MLRVEQPCYRLNKRVSGTCCREVSGLTVGGEGNHGGGSIEVGSVYGGLSMEVQVLGKGLDLVATTARWAYTTSMLRPLDGWLMSVQDMVTLAFVEICMEMW